MKAFEFTTTISPAGEIRVSGVPFTAGTEVEVLVSPKRAKKEEFHKDWERVCQALRKLPQVQQLEDSTIQEEVMEHRAGR